MSPASPLPSPNPAPSAPSPASEPATSLAPLNALAALERLVPARALALARSGRARVRAAVLDLVPLPLYEVWKLQSLDPFVPRASVLSYRTSGKHFLILAGSPMSDRGGGRAAQLAQELLSRAHRVTYVHRFGSKATGRRRRSPAHENLTHVGFDRWSARSFAKERGSRERIVAVCELPLPEYAACARYLKAHGVQVIYDCTADWSGPAGRGWYVRRAEEALLRDADQIVASARCLKDGLESRSWRTVALLPNGVNTRVFARGREQQRPVDLPRADGGVFTFVGDAGGPCFAWDWLAALARAQPGSAVVVIGEGPCRHRELAPNLYCLGPRPQETLPAYLAHSEVCLLPLQGGEETRPANPLEAFECLAMGKPLVCGDLPELHDLPGVFAARNSQEFVEAVARARTWGPAEETLARFVADNSWRSRVRNLERLMGV